jgi:hypothetical protein
MGSTGTPASTPACPNCGQAGANVVSTGQGTRYCQTCGGSWTPRVLGNQSGMPAGARNDAQYDSIRTIPNPSRFQPASNLSGQPAAPPVPALQIHPPWEYPPTGSNLFNVNADTNSAGVAELAAGVGAQVIVPGLNYQTPNNYIPVVRTVTIFINAPDLTANVNFYLRANGNPVQNGAFRWFPLVAANLSIAYAVTFRDIQQNAYLDLLIVNAGAGGPWIVGGGFSGWAYSVQMGAALTGGLPN